MNCLKTLGIFSFVFACVFQALGQTIAPPCARMLPGANKDSLVWQATTCTGFGGYVLEQATLPTGPFSAVATLSATGTTIPNSNTTNYYRIGLLCNGSIAQYSTIVSNQAPHIPDLKSVSMQGPFPVISWGASRSPEVIGYQVYKEQPYGSGQYFPYPSVGTLASGLSYTDVGATDLLNRYAIAAVSSCNKSLFGEGKIDGTTGPHTSIVLEGTLDSCRQQIKLDWNAYENWENGVKHYVLWRAVNGASAQPYDTIAANLKTYSYEGANDNEFLSFYIEAVEANRSNSAYTNNWSINVEANRPMDYMYFTSATVANAGEIALKWQWDTDVDLGEIRLMRGDRPESLVELLSFNRAVSLNNSFSELNLNTADQAYYYQLKSTDACGFEVNSAIVRTLLLKGRAIEDLVNVLAWEAPLLGDAKVLNYELFRTDERGVTRVGEIPPGQLTFEDKMELRRFGRAEACYHLIANLSLEQADGTQLEIVLQSNDFCLKQKSVIQIPNAFAPNSQKVNFFRPLIAFESSVSDYSMQIFDRNAGLLFKTEDLHEGWEGNSISGRFIQQGVYVYLIRFTQADGTPVVKKGTVTLLR